MAGKLREGGDDFASEVVADKAYHSKEALTDLRRMNIGSYASRLARDRQKWKGDENTQAAVHGKRRRIKASVASGC